MDLTHLSDLAGMSWLRLRARDNCHHKGLREERNLRGEKSRIVKAGEEEPQDESLEVKWQESHEMRLRA